MKKELYTISAFTIVAIMSAVFFAHVSTVSASIFEVVASKLLTFREKLSVTEIRNIAIDPTKVVMLRDVNHSGNPWNTAVVYVKPDKSIMIIYLQDTFLYVIKQMNELGPAGTTFVTLMEKRAAGDSNRIGIDPSIVVSIRDADYPPHFWNSEVTYANPDNSLTTIRLQELYDSTFRVINDLRP